MNRVPEYVDAAPAVQKEIRELIKLGGYRNLAKQKSIVKKFIAATPAQKLLLIGEIEATPQAVAIKQAMKDEQAYLKAEKKILEDEKKADKKKKLQTLKC